MSLESWMREFYPVDADKVREEDAVAHSLRKWRGLTGINMNKHEVLKSGTDIIDIDENYLQIDSRTCALCQCHVVPRSRACDECPLFVLLGDRCDGEEQPYDYWVDTGNPVPMIKALEKIS